MRKLPMPSIHVKHILFYYEKGVKELTHKRSGQNEGFPRDLHHYRNRAFYLSVSSFTATFWVGFHMRHSSCDFPEGLNSFRMGRYDLPTRTHFFTTHRPPHKARARPWRAHPHPPTLRIAAEPLSKAAGQKFNSRSCGIPNKPEGKPLGPG